jgi:hypothetical protein
MEPFRVLDENLPDGVTYALCNYTPYCNFTPYNTLQGKVSTTFLDFRVLNSMFRKNSEFYIKKIYDNEIKSRLFRYILSAHDPNGDRDNDWKYYWVDSQVNPLITLDINPDLDKYAIIYYEWLLLAIINQLLFNLDNIVDHNRYQYDVTMLPKKFGKFVLLNNTINTYQDYLDLILYRALPLLEIYSNKLDDKFDESDIKPQLYFKLYRRVLNDMVLLSLMVRHGQEPYLLYDFFDTEEILYDALSKYFHVLYEPGGEEYTLAKSRFATKNEVNESKVNLPVIATLPPESPLSITISSRMKGSPKGIEL